MKSNSSTILPEEGKMNKTMKKALVVLAIMCALMGAGNIFSKNLQTMVIKNEADRAIRVSFGYNLKQMQSFLVWIDRKSTLTIKNWDVDRPTNIFINDEWDPTISAMTRQWKNTSIGQFEYLGFMYVLPAGKAIDVKYSAPKGSEFIKPAELFDYSIKLGLHSNSMFYADKDILIKCAAGELKPVTECSNPFVDKLQMNKKDPAQHIEEYELFSPRDSKQERKDLQTFVDIMLLRFEHGILTPGNWTVQIRRLGGVEWREELKSNEHIRRG